MSSSRHSFDHVRPDETLVNIRSKEIVADRIHGGRSAPSAVAFGLVPTAGKHIIFAVGRFDDLPVPIIPFLRGGVRLAVCRCERKVLQSRVFQSGLWVT